MQSWLQFYTVIAGAAATLLGLLFVVISMNAAATLGPGSESSRRLAEQAFQNYVAVLLVSLLALFPDTKLTTFSFVTLSVTALSAVWVLVRLYLAFAKPADREPRLFALRRHATSVIGFGMLVVAAVRMALRYDDDRNWFASGVMVLLFSATLVSWDLLVRIARVKAADAG